MNELSDFLEEEAMPRNILLEKYFRINSEYMPIVDQYEIEISSYNKSESPHRYPSIFNNEEKENNENKEKKFCLYTYLYRIIYKNMTIVDIKKVINIYLVYTISN
jgi:hypothetical protein